MAPRWTRAQAGIPPRDRRALILACLFFWSVFSYVLISRFVLQTAAIVGDSMSPTFLDGQRHLILRWVPWLREPRRGEIVGLRVPGDDVYSVKRVIALPGEVIQIRGGRVYVDGQELIEPYLGREVPTFGGPLGGGLYEVAEGCFFVMGDNRTESLDSRFYGAVKREWIVGAVK
jgi:signal peptidase I